MAKNKNRRQKLILSLAAGHSLVGGALAMATSYTWASPTASGTWQTAANWNPNTGTPSLATDAALLNDATANRTVTYSSTANVTIGTLSITQSDNDLNLLDLQLGGGGAVLTISNPTTIGASNGTARVFVDPTNVTGTETLGGTFTISSGGVLELSSYDNTFGTASPQVTGNVTVAGGTFMTDRSSGTGTLNTDADYVTGSLTMTSGTISFANNVSTGLASSGGAGTLSNEDRLIVSGNLTISGGTFTVGYAANADVIGDELYLDGTTNSITGLSGSNALSSFVILNGGGNQQLLSDAALPGGLAMRSSAATGSSQTYIVGATTSSGLLTIGSILRFQEKAGTQAQTLKLASNIDSTSTIALNSGGTTLTFGVDLNGFTLDVTAANAVEKPPSTGTTTTWNIINSGGSSAVGTFRAAAFDLSGANGGESVGSYVNLLATGVGSTSILSNAAGAISPTSTFTYAGTATGIGSLTSSRTIGNLAVTSQTLNLGSAITTGTNSTVTIASAGTLNLNGFALSTTNFTNNGGVLNGATASSSLSVTGVLAGTGTIGGSAGIILSGSLAPGGVGTVGTLNVANGSGALTLRSSNASNFDFASDSSYDTMVLNSVAVTFGGTLNLNFIGSYAPAQGTQYTIFSGLSAGEDTNFTTITSNLSGYTFDFNDSSGVLTVDSVPEPASLSLLGASTILMLRRRRLPVH